MTFSIGRYSITAKVGSSGRIVTSGQPTEPQLADIHALGVRHIILAKVEMSLKLVGRHRKAARRSDVRAGRRFRRGPRRQPASSADAARETIEVGFAMDSPLEEGGFEPSVPLYRPRR